MGRILKPQDITGPFAGTFMDNVFSLGSELDMGAILTGATVTTQKTPLNDGDVDTYGTVYTSNAGNITGVLVQAGLYVGQLLAIVNYGSGTITFAAVGTSLVLNGVTGAIAINTGWLFRWTVQTNINSGTGCWVHIG